MNAQSLCQQFGISPQQTYDLLRKATDRLARRWVTIHAPDPLRPGLAATKTPLVHAIDYSPACGRLHLYLAPRMLPHLRQLAAAFAQCRPRAAERPSNRAWGDALHPSDDLAGGPRPHHPNRRNGSGRGSGLTGEPGR